MKARATAQTTAVRVPAGKDRSKESVGRPRWLRRVAQFIPRMTVQPRGPGECSRQLGLGQATTRPEPSEASLARFAARINNHEDHETRKPAVPRRGPHIRPVLLSDVGRRSDRDVTRRLTCARVALVPELPAPITRIRATRVDLVPLSRAAIACLLDDRRDHAASQLGGDTRRLARRR
jgi:hypothetical protein